MPITRRSSRLRRGALMAVTAALSLTLVACGSDDSSDSAGVGTVTASDAGVRTVSASDAARAASEEGVVVIDVRTPEEFAAGHLEQARNLPLGDAFRDQVGELPRDGRYLLYCQSGNRSGQAAQVMEQLGFTDVLDGGGIPDLAAAGASVVTS